LALIAQAAPDGDVPEPRRARFFRDGMDLRLVRKQFVFCDAPFIQGLRDGVTEDRCLVHGACVLFEVAKSLLRTGARQSSKSSIQQQARARNFDYEIRKVTFDG
jgi:hypothetical protein